MYLIVIFLLKISIVLCNERISPLLNQTWLYNSGSHGLTLKPHSTTYLFAGLWTQLVEIKFPMHIQDNIKIINGFNNCTVLDEEPDDEFCGDYVKMIDLMIQILQDYRSMSLAKLEHLIRDTPLHTWLRRSKRSIIPFIGDALSILFGTAVNSDVKEVKRNFDTLNDEIEKGKKNHAFLQKQLLGFSKIFVNTSKNFDTNLGLVVDKIKKLDNFIVDVLNNNSHIYSNYMIFKHSDKKFNEGLINILIGVFKAMRTNDIISEIKSALIELREGKLPISLLPWISLKPILNGVEQEIAPMYSLGIDSQNWDLYYNLPLTKFTLIKEGILLKLNIPLKVDQTSVKFELFQPVTQAIPCNTSFCKWHDRIQNNDTYITLDIKNRLWVTDKYYKEIKGEINAHSLDCISIANERLCISYDKSLMSPTSACTLNLWEWVSDKIIEFCKFEISLSESYTPVQLSQNLFLVHKMAIPRYDYVCLGGNSKSKEVIDWAEEITIDTGCYVKTHDNIIVGPLKFRDSRLDTIQTQYPDFIFDKKLEINSGKMNQKAKKPIKIHKKSNTELRYKSTDFENQVQLNSRAITAAVDSLWESVEYESAKVNYVIERQSYSTTTSKINAGIDCISSTMVFIAIAAITMNFLSSGYRFMFITPLLIRPVQMVRIEGPETSANIFQTYKEEPVLKSFQLILIISGVILYVLINKFKCLRACDVNHYVGSYVSPSAHINNNCYINICFRFSTRKWFFTSINEVTITYNADFLDNTLTHGNMYLESNLKTWCIIEIKNEYKICIPTGIKLLIDFMHSETTRSVDRIEMPVKLIVWRNDEIPEFDKAIQVFGDAHLFFNKINNRSSSGISFPSPDHSSNMQTTPLLNQASNEPIPTRRQREPLPPQNMSHISSAPSMPRINMINNSLYEPMNYAEISSHRSN